MALADLLINIVSLTKYGTPVNVKGVNVPSATVVSGVNCSIQESSSAPTFGQDKAGSTSSGKAFFASDPGLQADDLINWGPRKLTVIGPAMDEAGRGVLWTCRWTETR
jgi:hypothetical protein